MILALGLLPFFSTFLGGWAVFRLHNRLHAIMAFAAGVLVATALVDLIPESIDLVGGADPAVTTGIAAIVGFLIYAAVEAFIHQSSYEHVHDTDVDHAAPHDHPVSGAASTLGWLGPAGLIVHSTLDGAAIGLAFAASSQVGLLVLLAVLVHDFADGLNVVTLAFAGGRGRRAALGLLALDALAPIVGIALSQVITLAPANLGILLGVFAGAFLAIGASHLLPEAQHRQSASVSPLVILVVAGAALVVVVRALIP
ncbi:MAG: ZIP family metal transporter [Chloroflexota bacterium]